MNNKVVFLVIGLVIGILATWLVLSNSRTTVSNTMQNTSMMRSSDTMDAHFIEQMIPHHEDAITMANLALENSQRPEIRQLSESIIDSQSKEIDLMKKWYTDWFKRELPRGEEVMMHHGMGSSTGMHMGIRGDQDDILALTEAEDFDKAFLEHMIPHHQMAVMMANMLKNSTDRPEMKKLADDIIAAQTSEIEQMREWLREWE